MEFWEKLVPITQEGWTVKMVPSSVVTALKEALKLLDNEGEENLVSSQVIDKNNIEDYISSGISNPVRDRLYKAMNSALKKWNDVTVQFCKWWIGTVINWDSSFFSKDTKMS